MPFRRIAAIISGLFAASGCSASHEGSLPVGQPASFTLTEVDSQTVPDGELKTWRAVPRTGSDRSFGFRLELLMKRPKGSMPFAFSKGAFVRDGHSDGTPFLKQIAEAIDAEGDVPSETERTERLEFSTAILGTSLSRQSGSDAIGGSFTSTKPGGWTVLKLFLADGEAEVYLNINPTLGQGEFATKDPEYGPVVIAEFAKVFLP